MRICFFSTRSLLEGGGGENWIIKVSRSLAKYHHVHVIGLKYAETKRLHDSELMSSLEEDKIRYQEFPCIKPPKGAALPNPLFAGRILSIFNSSDLVYVMLPMSPVERLFYLLKKCFKSRLIGGFHFFLRSDMLLHRLYMPIFKKSLDAFDAYHVLNRRTYVWLQKMGFNNIFYIPNGVDTKTFQLCRNPSNSQFFNILFTGRLTEDKGVDVLIEIIRYINEKLKIQNIKFTITGSGPLEDRINAIAQKYNNVNFLGFVDINVLPKIYANANLFLIPSKMEGMPLRLLEAQSCGLPVVGSKIFGILDVVINGKTGYLMNVGDIKGFAESIKKYYELWCNSSREYYNMNKAIREHITRNYDWNIIIEKIEKMFKEMCIYRQQREGNTYLPLL